MNKTFGQLLRWLDPTKCQIVAGYSEEVMDWDELRACFGNTLIVTEAGDNGECFIFLGTRNKAQSRPDYVLRDAPTQAVGTDEVTVYCEVCGNALIGDELTDGDGICTPCWNEQPDAEIRDNDAEGDDDDESAFTFTMTMPTSPLFRDR